MANDIFRKKSLEKMSAPDDLNSYIKVANPGVWIILGAIVALIVGVLVWGTVGKIETKILGAAMIEDGRVTNYIKYENSKSIRVGQEMRVNGTTCKLDKINPTPILVDEYFNRYLGYIGNFKIGDLVYELSSNDYVVSISGPFSSVVVTGSMPPLQFIFN